MSLVHDKAAGASLENVTEITRFSSRIGSSVTLDYAARLLGISRRTIYNRIRDGFLQTVQVNGGQRVDLNSLLEYIRDHRIQIAGKDTLPKFATATGRPIDGDVR